MAFFGVTQLGYQDTIREHVRDPKMTPIAAFRSGAYRDPNFRLPQVVEPCQLSADEAKQNKYAKDQMAGYNRGPCGSNEELRRLKHKHITSPKENTDIYRRPLTTSADIGLWRKDEPLVVNEPWSYVKRHAHLKSEMTRFVDDMALTNPTFSLY
jgi:hypothetical protein